MVTFVDGAETCKLQGLPGHVDLILEEDVIKGSLQVCLVTDVTLVIVAVHLHDIHVSRHNLILHAVSAAVVVATHVQETQTVWQMVLHGTIKLHMLALQLASMQKPCPHHWWLGQH